MKKVLLSLLAVAALVLSCQNYDDEFAALNTKIASLESQITSLAELRTAVTGVQSSISSLQSAVAAAQAAAEAADNADAISALATSVAAIAADLVDLQTAIDGATTEADLDALKEELNTTLAALQSLIETNSASIASLVTSNTDLRAALDALGVDVTSILASNATFEGSLTITNAAELAYAKSLGNKVSTIRGDVYVLVDETKHTGGGTGEGLTAAEVNSVVSQITFVVGNVKIDSDVSLDLSKLASVSGDYIVKNHDVSDDALLTVGGNMHLDYDGAYKSNVETAGNIFIVARAKAAATTTVPARLGTTEVDFSALKKATGVQTVTTTEAGAHTSGASVTYDVNEADKKIVLVSGSTTNATTSVKIGQAPVIQVVGGSLLKTIELHYAADYSSTNTSGSSALASLAITAPGLTSATVKAMSISGNVTISSMSSTATVGTATVDLSLTKTIGGKLTSDAASNKLDVLTSVAGISLSEQVSVSIPLLTTSKSTLDSSNDLDLDGDMSFAKATSLSLPKLSVVGRAKTSSAVELLADITANRVTGTVSLPALTLAGDLSFGDATGFVAPSAFVRSVDLDNEATTFEAKSVSILQNSFEGIPDLGSLTSLKLHGQHSNEINISSEQVSSLVAVDVSGGAKTHLDSAVALESLTIIGVAPTGSAANLDIYLNKGHNVDLGSVTLGGALNTVLVDTHDGTEEDLGDSSSLTSLTTSGTIHSITVSNNFHLTSLSLGHTEDLLASTAPVIVVDNNIKLPSFSTAVTMISTIQITNNSSLGSFDLSSISSVPSNLDDEAAGGDAIKIHIYNNHLSPTKSALLTGTAAGSSASVSAQTVSNWNGLYGTFNEETVQARVYGQSSIATLKNLANAIVDAFPGTSGAAATDQQLPTLDLAIGYKAQDSATTTGDIILFTTGTTKGDYSVSGDPGDATTWPTALNTLDDSGDNAVLLAELLKFQ